MKTMCGMMRNRLAWCMALMSFELAACNEVGWYEERQPVPENEVLYAFHEVDSEMRVAWVPSAMLASDDGTLLYADSGTRKLMAFSEETGKVKTIADLSPYEGALSYRLSGAEGWGKSLLRLNDDVVLLAAPGRRLAVIDTKAGEVFIVGAGDALLPEAGIALEDADFSLLSGIGMADDQLFLAFDQRIFSVPLAREHVADSLAQNLSKATLNHVAGADRSTGMADGRVVDARLALLNLGEWTPLLWHDETLFYWSPPHLMGIRNGHLMAVGGGGGAIHGDDLETARFYGLEQNPNIHLYGEAICTEAYASFYWMCVHLASLDFEAGKATGSVSYTYVDAPEMDAASVTAGGQLYGASWRGGGLWRIAEDGAASLQFGMASEEERFDAASAGDASVSPAAIVSPLAVSSFGDFMVTLSTTLARITLSEVGQDKRVMPIWIDLEQHGRIKHIATDADTLYMANGMDLDRIVFSEDALTDSRYAGFFKPVLMYGLPGKALDIDPKDSMTIYAHDASLLVYVTDKQWLFQSDFDDAQFVIEPAMAFQFPTKTEGVELRYLSIRRMAAMDSDGQVVVMASNDDEGGKIVIGNAGNKRLQVAGMYVGTQKARLLTTGSDEVVEGSRIQNVQFMHIDAVSLDAAKTLWIVGNGALWHVDNDGVLEKVDAVLPPAHDVTRLWVVGDDDHRTFFARTARGIVQSADAQTWLDTPYVDVSQCGNGWAAVDGQKLYLGHDMEKGDAYTSPVVPESVSCASEVVYVSGVMDNGKRAVFRARRDDTKTWARVMGGGFGVPDQMVLSQAALGANCGKMFAFPSGQFYVWVKDTCTLWMIDNIAELNAQTRVKRVVSDAHLCSADAVAVSETGDVAVVDGSWIYQLGDKGFVEMAAIHSRCFDLQYISRDLVALSEDGMSVYCHGQRQALIESPVRMGDAVIDFAQPGDATPRFTGFPNENAVIVPVLYGGQVLKLGYPTCD